MSDLKKQKIASKSNKVLSPTRPGKKEETMDDFDILSHSLVDEEDEFYDSDANDAEDIAQLHRTVQSLFEEEESLLNLHMSIIQENAELLTEEGKLLQTVQNDAVVDYDIDAYANRLGSILDRKTYLIAALKDKLSSFRNQLKQEEELSKKVTSLGY